MNDDPGDKRLAIRCASLYVGTSTNLIHVYTPSATFCPTYYSYHITYAIHVGECGDFRRGLNQMQAYGLNQILIGCSQKMIVWKDHRDC